MFWMPVPEDNRGWKEAELEAAKLVSLVTELYSSHNVEIVISGRSLIGLSPFSCIRYLLEESRRQEMRFTARESARLLEGLRHFSLHPCRIDLSVLLGQWIMCERPVDLQRFFSNTLGRRFLTPKPRTPAELSVTLVGFGRIARVLTRILARYGPASPIRIRSILTRSTEKQEIERRAHLLANDSVYGPFDGTINVYESDRALTVNGITIQFQDAQDPDWNSLRGGPLVDTTGRSPADALRWAARALEEGVPWTIFTAPVAGVPTILHGENQHLVHGMRGRMFSSGSHEANAVIPVLRLLDLEYQLTDATVRTVVPYTNDQNLLDNLHDTPRLGRAAPENLVLLDSTLEEEIREHMPGLSFSASSLRVPIPVGGLASIQFQAERVPSISQLNDFLRDESLRGGLRSQLEFSSAPDLVSSDIIENPHSAVIDSARTSSNGRHSVVHLWYDNEYGYASQLLRVLQELCNLSVMQYG